MQIDPFSRLHLRRTVLLNNRCFYFSTRTEPLLPHIHSPQWRRLHSFPLVELIWRHTGIQPTVEVGDAGEGGGGRFGRDR